MIALPLLLTAGAARAQTEPKFAFGKAEEVKAVKQVEWTAQVKGGAIATTGNSQSETGTLSATVSRKEGNNKLAIEGAVAYGRSNIRTPVLAAPDPTMPAMPPTIVGLERREVTTTNNWVVKGRYDRFFTLNNAGYLSAQSAADPLAGKAFTGGGQLGYSRQLVNTGMHLLVAEVGYDLSHERYVQQPGKTLDPVTIHSARFLFYIRQFPICGRNEMSERWERLSVSMESLLLFPFFAPATSLPQIATRFGTVLSRNILLAPSTISFKQLWTSSMKYKEEEDGQRSLPPRSII